MQSYKLKSEIKEFILQKAREHPELGCRKLSGLIQEAFKLDISKSTVGTVLKSEGLNKAVGRRNVKKKEAEPPLLRAIQPTRTDQKEGVLILPAPASKLYLESAPATLIREEPDTLYPNMGCWFLKAAELCLGGARAISDILSSIEPEGNGLPSDRQSQKKDDKKPSDLVPLIEALFYLALFGAQEYKDLDPASRDALSVLVQETIPLQAQVNHFPIPELSQLVSLQLFNRLVALRTGVLGLKFILEDNSFFFLDAGFHSIWSTNRIPKYFGSGLEKTKEWLNEAMAGIKPFILQAPPGFDTPTPAFLNFLAGFQSEKPAQAIKRIELYSMNNLLIDTIQPLAQKKRYFILGLWPWQYKETRHKLTLRDIGYKKDGREILTIMTNFTESQESSDKVITYYLERWPNLEIGYQDFLDKIGHFRQRSQIEWRQKNNVQFPEDGVLTLSGIVAYWRQELNLFCQEYFLPPSCRELDFLALKERFYNLRGGVNSAAAVLMVVFGLPRDFPHLKDLSYACQRVNEADIHLIDGRRLVFEMEHL